MGNNKPAERLSYDQKVEKDDLMFKELKRIFPGGSTPEKVEKLNKEDALSVRKVLDLKPDATTFDVIRGIRNFITDCGRHE